MVGYDIHLVGSVPLLSATQVFERLGATLGPRLSRVPDRETAERAGWMGWLSSAFELHPYLEPSGETFRPRAAGRATIRYRLKSSTSRDQIEFQNLQHAKVATQTYEIFSRLKQSARYRRIPLPIWFRTSDFNGEPLRSRVGTGRH
jgi:hypothetical protein